MLMYGKEICFKRLGTDMGHCSLPKDHMGIVHISFFQHDISDIVMVIAEIPEPIAPRILYPISK